MKLRLAAPTLLVDLRRIGELTGIERENGTARIGAMTTHHQVATGDLGLASVVAATIADQQVRNRGTLGGSLAHGDPASDMPAVLLATEGSVSVTSGGGSRDIAAAELFQDYLTTAIDEDEIVTAVNLPVMDGYGFGYQKFNRRREDWAMVAVSALVKKAGDGSCEDVRIGLTHMGNVPLRATAAEQALRGAGARRREHRRGGRAGGGGHRARPADLNATADYKRHLARVLCRRALEEAAA